MSRNGFISLTIPEGLYKESRENMLNKQMDTTYRYRKLFAKRFVITWQHALGVPE
jgi:hypothetical protein